MRKFELEPPSHCDACCSPNVSLTTNDRIYGRVHGNWPYVYFCDDCKAAVGCHPDTHIPLGRMADKTTRHIRAKVHESFDPIWRSGLMSRSDAYRWLAAALNIEYDLCHISWLSREQLIEAREKSTVYFAEREHIVERRKEKKRDRSIKRNNRARNAIIARKRQR